MKQIWTIGAMVVGAVAISSVLVLGHDRASGPQSGPNQQSVGLPWQITTLPAGRVGVMGLTLGAGGSTLADAQKLWGPMLELAVVAAPGEDGTLEAFVDPVSAGFISGKLVLTLDAPATAVVGLKARAVKSDYMESTTKKYTLAMADREGAAAYAISALTFIPQAKLDAASVLARFGAPQERLRTGRDTEHFLYPARGLDLALNARGKDVLQYVAPADFERLSAPLHGR
ncbi:MAG: hypothetical protein KGN37_06770 [Burkholderiales bacterium]|nr:hypothetical protein [Burkholderiales bacterium]